MKTNLTQYLLMCGTLALMTQLATATTYTVTNDADTGTGSLRWAINQANDHPNNGADPFDTVEFDPAYFSSPRTITLLLDELAPSGPAKIVGPGTDLLTISGNDARRVFFVRSNATIEISDVTIAHGLAVQGGPSFGTGAQGGGIHNQGALTLNAVTFRSNRAELSSESPFTRGGGDLQQRYTDHQ